MNKQIDGATLAVLNCYRNKYYTDGNNTEQGLVANAINEVLPTLFEFKNGGYRKQSRGEWVWGELGGREARVCSLCGAGFTGDNSEWIAKEHDFFPKCGAYMKYESEGAE